MAERLAKYELIFEFSFHVLKSKNSTLFFIETRNLKEEYWTHRIMHSHERMLS